MNETYWIMSGGELIEASMSEREAIWVARAYVEKRKAAGYPARAVIVVRVVARWDEQGNQTNVDVYDEDD